MVCFLTSNMVFPGWNWQGILPYHSFQAPCHSSTNLLLCLFSLSDHIYETFLSVVFNFYQNPVSQSCAVAKSEKFWQATEQSSVQTAGCNKSLQSLVFVLTQLHFCQWSSLPFCLSGLAVQWSIRIFHLWLLHMIVNLAYCYMLSSALFKLKTKFAKRWILFGNNVNTTIRKYLSRAFIWVVTPSGFIGQFRI